MSTGTQANRGSQAGSKPASQPATGSAGKRTRKEYSHELTAEENYALQTVQRAAASMKVLNDAIRSGKKVNPEVIKLCFQLQQAAGDMLFKQD